MKTILYVEDNEMNRDMLSRRLARRGYEVVVRSLVADETDRISGKLARWADSGEVDVVLLPSVDSEIIAEGEYYGMQTFDQHLLELYRSGRITLKDALAAATSPHDLRIAVRAAGLQA